MRFVTVMLHWVRMTSVSDSFLSASCTNWDRKKSHRQT